MANVTSRVAPKVINTMVPPEIGLCVLEMDPPPGEKMTTESSIADGRLGDAFQVLPLAGAWVLIEPPAGEGPDPWLFLTDKLGLLQRLDPNGLGVKPHHEIQQFMLQRAFGPGGGSLTYAWCRSLSLFQSMIQDYVAAPSTWRERWPTATMEWGSQGVGRLIQDAPLDDIGSKLQDALPAGFVDLSDSERKNLALLLHNQGPDGRTFFYSDARHFPIVAADGTLAPQDKVYYFARRPAIAAMFLSEVITCYAVSLAQRSQGDYQTFSEGLALRKSLDGATSDYRRLLARQRAGDLTPEQRYLLWAHDCGVAKMSVTDFKETLPTSSNNATFLVVLEGILGRYPSLHDKHPLGPTTQAWTEDPEGNVMLWFRDTGGKVFESFAEWRVSSELADFGDSDRFIASAYAAKCSAAELVRQIAADDVLEKRSLLQQLIPEACTQTATWLDFATLCTRWMCAHLAVKRIWIEAISAEAPTDVGAPEVDPAGESVAALVGEWVKRLGFAQYYYDLVTSFFDAQAQSIARLAASSLDRIPKLLASANALQKALGIQRLVDLTTLQLEVDPKHQQVVLKRFGIWFGYFNTVDHNGVLKVIVDEKSAAGFGTLFDEKQQEALARIGFHNPADRQRVPRMVGVVGAVAVLAGEIMGLQDAIDKDGAVAYFEVAKDTGYAVAELAECVEAVLHMLALNQNKGLKALVDKAVEAFPEADAKVAALAAARRQAHQALAAAQAKLDAAKKAGASEPKVSGLKKDLKAAAAGADTADQDYAVATLERDDLRASLPSSRAQALFDALRDNDHDLAAAIEEGSMVEHVESIVGRVGGIADRLAVPLDVVITFRDGVIKLWSHDSIADDVRGSIEVVGGLAAGIELAGWLVADAALAAALPPASLILAGVAILLLGVDAIEAMFSSPDELLPLERQLRDAQKREGTSSYPHTWEATLGVHPTIVCNTQAALLSLAAGLHRTLALPL